jgi:hypothetical protein
LKTFRGFVLLPLHAFTCFSMRSAAKRRPQRSQGTRCPSLPVTSGFSSAIEVYDAAGLGSGRSGSRAPPGEPPPTDGRPPTGRSSLGISLPPIASLSRLLALAPVPVVRGPYRPAAPPPRPVPPDAAGCGRLRRPLRDEMCSVSAQAWHWSSFSSQGGRAPPPIVAPPPLRVPASVKSEFHPGRSSCSVSRRTLLSSERRRPLGTRALGTVGGGGGGVSKEPASVKSEFHCGRSGSDEGPADGAARRRPADGPRESALRRLLGTFDVSP